MNLVATAVVGARQSIECTLMTMDRLLTADELAERLHVNTEWVWAQAKPVRV
jgi:hypothetical protein